MTVLVAEYTCACGEDIGIYRYKGAAGPQEWVLGARHKDYMGNFVGEVAVVMGVDSEWIAKTLVKQVESRFRYGRKHGDRFKFCSWVQT